MLARETQLEILCEGSEVRCSAGFAARKSTRNLVLGSDFCACFFKHFLNLHFLTTSPLTLVGGLHECVKLERLLEADGNFTSAEHVNHGVEQNIVTVVRTNSGLSSNSSCAASVPLAVLAVFLAEYALAPVNPSARNLNIAVSCFSAGHRLAPRPHHGKEALASVDSVPIEVGV